MELEPTDEQRFFQETTRKFLEAETPITTVRALAADPDGFDRAWWRRGAELGWTSLLVDEANGGGSLSGAGLLDLAIVAEEMGRAVAPGPLVPTNVVARTISRVGTPEQRAAVLPLVLAGDSIATWCLREPGRGWDADGVAMRAEPSAAGFVLDGRKVMVEAGAQADWLLVTARAPQGLTQFLLPASTPGITVQPAKAMDLVRRFAAIDFTGVVAGPETVVGQPGGAADDVADQFLVTLVLQCAEIVGATGKAFEFTLQYAFDRYSFGRPIASYQALKHRFADMKTWLEASYATTLAAGAAVSDGRPDAAKLASVAKAYVADRCPEILQDCVQMHGGIGVTWEHDLHLYLRRAVLQAGLFGNADHHRERVFASMGA